MKEREILRTQIDEENFLYNILALLFYSDIYYGSQDSPVFFRRNRFTYAIIKLK